MLVVVISTPNSLTSRPSCGFLDFLLGWARPIRRPDPSSDRHQTINCRGEIEDQRGPTENRSFSARSERVLFSGGASDGFPLPRDGAARSRRQGLPTGGHALPGWDPDPPSEQGGSVLRRGLLRHDADRCGNPVSDVRTSTGSAASLRHRGALGTAPSASATRTFARLRLSARSPWSDI